MWSDLNNSEEFSQRRLELLWHQESRGTSRLREGESGRVRQRSVSSAITLCPENPFSDSGLGRR